MSSCHLLLLIAGLGLAAAVPATAGGGGGHHKDDAGGHSKRAGGHHKGAGGHDQNCVDISRYSDVQFNASLAEFCTYQVRQQCQSRQEQVCAEVPVQTCSLAPAPDCKQTPLGQQTVRNDQIAQRQYTPKVCPQSGTQTLNKPAQRPLCRQVTKPQHCESKWIINELGEKVWAGNENCQAVTAEECTLETYVIPIQVPVYACADGTPLTYNEPLAASESVTTYAVNCQAAAKTECVTTSTQQQCISVEVKDCVDEVVPVCTTGQGQALGADMVQSFQVPYQTFDHRLKCLA
jgi:hypothetical protein